MNLLIWFKCIQVDLYCLFLYHKENMQQPDFQRIIFSSRFLQRQVQIDIYASHLGAFGDRADLLLVNDGQDLIKMDFSAIW